MQEEYLTMKESAEFLGISVRTLYRLIDSGKIVPMYGSPLLQKSRMKFTKSYLESVLREAQQQRDDNTASQE